MEFYCSCSFSFCGLCCWSCKCKTLSLFISNCSHIYYLHIISYNVKIIWELLMGSSLRVLYTHFISIRPKREKVNYQKLNKIAWDPEFFFCFLGRIIKMPWRMNTNISIFYVCVFNLLFQFNNGWYSQAGGEGSLKPERKQHFIFLLFSFNNQYFWVMFKFEHSDLIKFRFLI